MTEIDTSEILDRLQRHADAAANRAAKEDTRGTREALSAAEQSLHSGGTTGITCELRDGRRVTGVVTAITGGGHMIRVAAAGGDLEVYAGAVTSAGIYQI